MKKRIILIMVFALLMAGSLFAEGAVLEVIKTSSKDSLFIF